ncbi:MAG: hypothetical protein AMS20_17615 [Gemmatimonas sp. SG8_28]|nr:MAG: hypothetical protein AMS20_17615 [Gemmatimonas sp. SG8_28]
MRQPLGLGQAGRVHADVLVEGADQEVVVVVLADLAGIGEAEDVDVLASRSVGCLGVAGFGHGIASRGS